MYTQCPDCGTAFRVTANVLRQAAGKVRCGGCGSAFNALDFLSEHRPVALEPPRPEETPAQQAAEPPELEADEPPEAISAERSAALLKTLDELAGSDIRIEDTGTEWRVLFEDERKYDVADEQTDRDDELADDTGSMRWFIDESPTPVDEKLSAEPGKVDAPEIFEAAAAAGDTEQMRFDDDTPLPEDFDFDTGPAEAGASPPIEVRQAPEELDPAQVDLAFGEPEDWEDLLGEVSEATDGPLAAEAGVIADDAADESPETEATVIAVNDNTGIREEEPLPDVDTQFATQAEAMGIDLSGIHAQAEKPAEPEEREEPEEPEEFEEPAEPEEFEQPAEPEEFEQPEEPEEFEQPAEPEEFEQPEEPEEFEEFEEPEKDASEGSTIDDDLIAAAFEAEAQPRADHTDREQPAETITDAADQTADGEDEDHGGDLELDVEELEDLIEAKDRELVSSTEDDAKLAAELGLLDDGKAEDDKPEQVIPPMSEEEQTINMMIDQDLLAIAVEDEEGFASTIIQKQRSEADDTADVELDEEAAADSAGLDSEEDSPLVETIIMEGEHVRDAFEEKRLEAERQKALESETEQPPSPEAGKSEKHQQAKTREPVNYRLVAGIAALALLLAAQFVHQSRESLAVYPAFNSSVGPVYRMLGKPVTPEWDIAGWRFEATKGSTDESDEVLTIYSRIGNKSEEALPYPLINVSLTDRFEDIIGSKILEPGDYLAENLDTRAPVAPGETFSAVISIEAPDAKATGFKLNVCYRQPGSRLRCAIDDFR